MHKMAATKARMKKRLAQMDFLLEITEPNLGPIYRDEEGFSLTGICTAILNHGHSNSYENGHLKPYSFITFMNNIQRYFPERLRFQGKTDCALWHWHMSLDQLGPETLAKMEECYVWFDSMKSMILDSITSDYYTMGKPQYIEIMKRRYKELYSEKTEQAVTADLNADQNIRIVIEDA